MFNEVDDSIAVFSMAIPHQSPASTCSSDMVCTAGIPIPKHLRPADTPLIVKAHLHGTPAAQLQGRDFTKRRIE